jgi:hypothetical protein
MIERKQVKRARSGKYGENHGDQLHFALIRLWHRDQIENKLQEAPDSVKAEKRVVTINQPFKLSHKIEMVALRSSRLGARNTQHGLMGLQPKKPAPPLFR